MMKHIRKKTVENYFANENKVAKPSSSLELKSNILADINYKDVKGKNAFVFYEGGDMLRAFFYNNNGKACTIPLANPVLIYFHNAQINLAGIYETRKELLSLFNKKEQINENSLNLFYNFFGSCSSFVLMLTTALEAFINQKIPDDYIYEKKETKFTSAYTKDQIERWISLDEKITNILNVKTKKNFAKQFPNREIFIANLKSLRDEIVHTKKSKGYEKYEQLFNRTLNFKYEDSINAVKDFINFYEPDLIENCPCGQDF